MVLSTALPHAGDWLNGVPSADLGLHLHDQESLLQPEVLAGCASPVREKQVRLASVEVEANEPFVLSTTWSATESSPGGPTRKPNYIYAAQ